MVWKDIAGYEGLYCISDTGIVKSYPKMSGGSPRKEHILRENVKRTGYSSVVLAKDGKHTTVLIHRLVASAFVPNPKNSPVVNHVDGNKLNNAASNLEWCTYSQNTVHAYNHGMNHRGENHYKSKLSTKQVSDIRLMCASGASDKDVAKLFDVSASTVYLIRTGRNRRHG